MGNSTKEQRTSSIFEQWAKEIADVIVSESKLARKTSSHTGMIGNAREAIIRNVLQRFIPSGYEIGTGQIIDHSGNLSKQIDIIISRRDFPALLRFDGSKLYTVESVLATIEVKSNLNSTTLKEALDNCYSVGDLSVALSGPIEEIAKKRDLKKYKNEYVHDNPIETARWGCNFRPASYVIGIKGYKSKSDKLKSAIYIWGSQTIDNGRLLALKHFPAVIIAEGCYAWRNDRPLSVSENFYLLGGNDKNPLRLLILHLLYIISDRIPSTAGREGMRPDPSVYLNQICPPDVKWMLFSAANPPDVKTEELNSLFSKEDQ